VGERGNKFSKVLCEGTVHCKYTRALTFEKVCQAAANPPAKDASAEELLALMDSNGVDKSVIVQPICYLYDNSYVGACIKTWPSRFAAVARVDPEDVNAPAHLAQLTAEGFVGVRFGPVNQTWWNAPNMLRILEKAQGLQVPVLLFLGKDGGKSIPWIEPVLRKVPDLIVVIDHMADVSPSDQAQVDNLLRLAALPQVYVKISHTWALSTEAYPWMDAQHLVKTVIAKFGANVRFFSFAKTNTREF